MSGGFLYSEFHCYTIAHWAPITTLDPKSAMVNKLKQKNFAKGFTMKMTQKCNA